MRLKKGVRELVSEAEKEISSMAVNEAVKNHGKDNFIFVDIRDVRELERDGMIPGAFHAPRGLLEFWVDPDSPYYKDIFGDPQKTYILYCASAWRSALATKALKDMGLENVVHFAGGLKGWKEVGGPIAQKAIRNKN
ncbi:MAG: rhodanese [Magnetovibrio sp.]|nr:rhodanese [Magnetovibrio sp.]